MESDIQKNMNKLMLITRAEVSSIEGLLGRPSHDDRENVEKVMRFFADWDLPPYPKEFRSVFIYYEGENYDPHGSAIKAYGNPFLLNQSTVIPSLEIVCSKDIQNAALNEIDSPEIAQRNFRRFQNLSEIPPEDIRARTIALTAALNRRERPQYVEARMPRTAVREDILRKLF